MPLDPPLQPAPADPSSPSLQPERKGGSTSGPVRHPPQSEGKARRLRIEADKLAACCLVVRAASNAADQAAFAEVGRAAAKALRAKFGGGSITTAFAWVAGTAGREALDAVLAGEVELTGPLSLQQVVEASALAQEAERQREGG